MATYAVPASVLAAQRARALAERPRPCGDGTGRGRTCGAEPAELYPRGWRCAAHAPTGTTRRPPAQAPDLGGAA